MEQPRFSKTKSNSTSDNAPPADLFLSSGGIERVIRFGKPLITRVRVPTFAWLRASCGASAGNSGFQFCA